MPIYEYCCSDCEQIFEEWQRKHDVDEAPCPVCGATAKRIMSNTSFVLKGTGWYVTDYASGQASHGSAKSDVASGTKSESASSTESAPPAKSSDTSAKAESSQTQS